MILFDELNLNKPLLNALADLDFYTPTPIQEKAFPIIMSGSDMVGIAQTGTGKTFAYLLPILKQLGFSDSKHPRVLIIVPTRELVLQVTEEIEKLTKYMNLRFAGVYGGTNINTQKQLVYNGLDILVGTPGRLIDLTLSGTLRLKSIQKLVIDEVDEMLNQGFRKPLTHFFENLPEKRQNLMFSATLTEDVEELIQTTFHLPKKVEIAPHGTPLEQIIQQAYDIPNFYSKANLLTHLLKTDLAMEKTLVFVGSRKLADRLFEQIKSEFPESIGVLHSNKSQNFRFNSLRKFDQGEYRILIATDLAARGLDITEVSHVINFDMPTISGDYIHRIGRTGRAEKAGMAISFINEVEKEYQNEVEVMMNKSISMLEVPESVEISTIFTDEERPTKMLKNHLKLPKLTGQGAFHEKSEKNSKENSGSPSKKRKKHKKPIKRSAKRPN
ncbi:MAG: DEAD/DEAH box helicase [Bacteroidales bacterium]|nr:DEAD/DEAH box helicase [Bacteroidales bacterium]